MLPFRKSPCQDLRGGISFSARSSEIVLGKAAANLSEQALDCLKSYAESVRSRYISKVQATASPASAKSAAQKEALIEIVNSADSSISDEVKAFLNEKVVKSGAPKEKKSRKPKEHKRSVVKETPAPSEEELSQFETGETEIPDDSGMGSFEKEALSEALANEPDIPVDLSGISDDLSGSDFDESDPFNL